MNKKKICHLKVTAPVVIFGQYLRKYYIFYYIKRYLSTLSLHFTAIGFNVETVQYKNLKFQVWDLGGQTSIRSV